MCSRLAAVVVLATGRAEASLPVGIGRIPVGPELCAGALELPVTSCGTACSASPAS